jgi:cytochrome c oxidase cbb3-type subunit 3
MRLATTCTLLCLLGLTAALGAGCDWMPGRPIRENAPRPESDVHDFDPLWTNYCSGCHGADGRFGPARPINDPVYLSIADDAYLRNVIVNGVKGTLMPPMAASQGGPMTDEQVGDVLKGIRTNWGSETSAKNVPPLQGKVGNAAKGVVVFASACASCHGADGKGTPVAGSVVDDAFLSMASDQALRSVIICGRLDLGMPDWRGRVGTRVEASRQGKAPLTSDQIDDLVAWLTSHRVKYPGAPYPDTADVEGGN